MISQLFTPLSIKDITFKNRIVVSPMCQYSSTDGYANDWHLVHLGSRAIGGAALIITEAAAVSAEGRISPDDLGIWKDDHVDGLKRIVSFIHRQNATVGIQLAHAGRKASCAKPTLGGEQLDMTSGGWKTVAPSRIPFKPENESPEPLDETGMAKIVDDYKNATIRAINAGFDVLEIHAAHGYLLHQFLSPLSNIRTDEYGGCFENRIRLLLRVINTVKEVWPKRLPLFVRLSATDWTNDGWDIDETVQLSYILKEQGVDLIDTSSGGLYLGQNIPIAAGYQVPFAERIKKETGILTGTVGLITDPLQAEHILHSHKADLIFLAREFLRDPYFPLHAASHLNEKITWPEQYARGQK